MTKRERVLLWVLVALAGCAAAWIGATALTDRVHLLRQDIAASRRQLGRLAEEGTVGDDLVDARELAALRERVAELEDALAVQVSTDPYAFGEAVRVQLVDHGISVEQIETVSLGEPVVMQFTGRGSADSVATFIRSVFADRRTWHMPYVSLQRGPGRRDVRFVIRLGYDL